MKGDQSRKQIVLVEIGSFSPITYLHLRLFEIAKDELEDNEYQVVGGFISPVSDAFGKKGLVSSKSRLDMCRLALEDHEWVSVDDWEAKLSTWSTTVEVLDSLQKRLSSNGTRTTMSFLCFSSVKLMLVSGADLILSFQVPDLWLPRDQEKIVRDHGLVIIERVGSDLSEYLLANPILYHHRVVYNAA